MPDQKSILVIGYGMVGKLIVSELSENYRVTVIDKQFDFKKENEGVVFTEKDILNDQLTPADVAPYDLIIGALPGKIGYQIAYQVLSLGKDYIDISFFPEDTTTLNEIAKKHGAMLIPDAGVAPGLSNIIAGYYAFHHGLTDFKCMVGGLPFERKKPFEYKAPFSPSDVIEEYTRPARIIRNGKTLELPPLTEIEQIHAPEIGTLEAFLSDGLRSLLFTIQAKNMEEKTLRYPGHAALMQAFKDSGFFCNEKMTINNVEVTPLDITSALLFKEWKLKPDDKEFTYMRIDIKCIQGQSHIFELLDKTDEKTGFSSMSRTTGYTTTAITEAYFSGKIKKQPGVIPPEKLAEDKSFYNFIITYLKNKGIQIRERAF